MICQKLEEANTDRRGLIGANLDPEQPNNIRVLLLREEVGWVIGKVLLLRRSAFLGLNFMRIGNESSTLLQFCINSIKQGGKVMKDIRKSSGASTWIKEGEEAYVGFDSETERVTEIQGRLEATLSCLELMLRVVEKFQHKQEYVVLLCPAYLASRLNVERISNMSKVDVSISAESYGDYKTVKIEGHDEQARRAATLVALKLAEFGIPPTRDQNLPQRNIRLYSS